MDALEKYEVVHYGVWWTYWMDAMHGLALWLSKLTTGILVWVSR
jgi:hypothetical protein